MLSGLPRSGSTVLSSMLNQHPEIHATTTSPIADLLGMVNENWPNLSAAVLDKNPIQYQNIITGIVDGAYTHIDKPIIVDKNRLWPRYGNFIRPAFGYKPKIICTVRNIPEVLASYILLIQKNNNKTTFVDRDLIESNIPVNNKTRCKLLWEKYVGHPYKSLMIGKNSGEVDMLYVDYDDIVNNGQATLDAICNFIEIDSYILNSNNLQPMDENDKFHGGIDGLHHIRPILARTSPPPEEVLGKELTQYYRDIKAEFWKK